MERTEALKILNKQLQVELGEKEKAEELLRVSEERYRFLFERNPAPMLIYDPASLKLLAVNEAFCNHYGYPEGEALNMNLPDLYPEEEKKPIIKLAQSLHDIHMLASGTMSKKEERFFQLLPHRTN
jgi:PAS domain-containing protein